MGFKPTLGNLVVLKLVLSTEDCVRPFASTFNIPNEVSEKLGKKFKKSSRPDLFHKETLSLLDAWLAGSVVRHDACWVSGEAR
jgi:hypothetical protein